MAITQQLPLACNDSGCISNQEYWIIACKMVHIWLYEMAFPGTVSFRPKYRDVPIQCFFIIYCNFAMWFIKVSFNALPVHVGVFCKEMSMEGAVYKGYDMIYVWFFQHRESILGMMWFLSSSKRWFVECHLINRIFKIIDVFAFHYKDYITTRSIHSRLINGRILWIIHRGQLYSSVWCV